MDLGIAGRKALVCAASKGLGPGCALALADAGSEVTIVARTEETLHRAAQEIEARAGRPVRAVACDIRTPEGRAAALAACGQPDILVNNAGGPIAVLTVALAALSLWIAFALLLNPVTGRRVFTLGTPVFRSAARPPVDLSVRTALVATLYGHWRDSGTPLASGDLRARLAPFGDQRLDAELAYLAARGMVENGDGKTHLSPAGIDLWERHLAG